MENQPLPLQKNKHNMFITCHKELKCKNYDEEGPNDTKNMLLPKWNMLPSLKNWLQNSWLRDSIIMHLKATLQL